MPMIWKEKERIIPLSEVQLDNIDGGMMEDMKFRPNKYFHPIEEVRVEGERCVILYHKELNPVEGKIPLEHIKHVIHGVIDGQQKLVQNQTIYLYPGVDAFGLDRRRNLRVALINVRPHKDWERSGQELCVDAFTQLIAEHCPEGHKKVVGYRQKILTLRHLLQVLEGQRGSSWFMSLFFLLLAAAGGVGLLYQWGPPRVQESIRHHVQGTIQWGRKMLRSSTHQWDVSLREERRRLEYRYPPVAFSLLLHPSTQDPQQRQHLHQELQRILREEFEEEPKAEYRLFVPHPEQFPEAYRRMILPPDRFPELLSRWKSQCDVLYPQSCPAQSWLLSITNYRGGFRPLLEAVQEVFKKSKTGGIDLKYQNVMGAVAMTWKAAPVSARPPVRDAGSGKAGQKSAKPSPQASPKVNGETQGKTDTVPPNRP